MKNKIIFIVSIILYFLIFIFLLSILSNDELDTSINVASYNNVSSYVVMDMKTSRVLASKNEHEIMLPASITKILTCLTAIKYYHLEDLIVIKENDVNIEGSKIYLKANDVVSVEDLLYGLMLNSGNDAALTLANHYSGNSNDFIFLMNQICIQIGMKNSIFENPSGLDHSTTNHTTAYDMALLMSFAMKNETFRKIAGSAYYQSISSTPKFIFKNKHKLVSNSLAIAGKTGYTKKAGRTLVSCFKKDDLKIVVVSLNASDDWNLHKRLANDAFSKYSCKQLVSVFKTLSICDNCFVKKSDLLVPIKEGEKISFSFIKTDKTYKLCYYKEDELIGYVLLMSMDKNE